MVWFNRVVIYTGLYLMKIFKNVLYFFFRIKGIYMIFTIYTLSTINKIFKVHYL